EIYKQLGEAIKKANRMLGYIVKSVEIKTRAVMFRLYNAPVRPHLDATVTHRIIDMADDVRCLLIEHIKMSRCFSLQVDEFTDVTDLANLHIYVRYEFEGMYHEDFMFFQRRETRLRELNIFTLEQRRLYGDLFKIFKIMKGIDQIKP
ncbi:F200B protein, partial [Amia calva]|nr:F200B protein [Amia calva]